MNSTNNLFYILILCIVSFLVILFVSLNTGSTFDNSDIDKQYFQYVKLNDSLSREIEIMNETTKRLNSIIDSTRSKIVYIEKIRYEKINSVDSITADSVLYLLTNYLSTKTKNRK